MEIEKGIKLVKPPMVLSNELNQDISEPITVKPPPKRILASMRVRLSSKDFKRRLPKPVILPETETDILLFR